MFDWLDTTLVAGQHVDAAPPIAPQGDAEQPWKSASLRRRAKVAQARTDDPIQGNMATESLDAMSQSYLGEPTYPLRDPGGGEERSLYRVRPNRVQVFGHA